MEMTSQTVSFSRAGIQQHLCADRDSNPGPPTCRVQQGFVQLKGTVFSGIGSLSSRNGTVSSGIGSLLSGIQTLLYKIEKFSIGKAALFSSRIWTQQSGIYTCEGLIRTVYQHNFQVIVHHKLHVHTLFKSLIMHCILTAGYTSFLRSSQSQPSIMPNPCEVGNGGCSDFCLLDSALKYRSVIVILHVSDENYTSPTNSWRSVTLCEYTNYATIFKCNLCSDDVEKYSLFRVFKFKDVYKEFEY